MQSEDDKKSSAAIDAPKPRTRRELIVPQIELRIKCHGVVSNISNSLKLISKNSIPTAPICIVSEWKHGGWNPVSKTEVLHTNSASSAADLSDSFQFTTPILVMYHFGIVQKFKFKLLNELAPEQYEFLGVFECNLSEILSSAGQQLSGPLKLPHDNQNKKHGTITIYAEEIKPMPMSALPFHHHSHNSQQQHHNSPLQVQQQEDGDEVSASNQSFHSPNMSSSSNSLLTSSNNNNNPLLVAENLFTLALSEEEEQTIEQIAASTPPNAVQGRIAYRKLEELLNKIPKKDCKREPFVTLKCKAIALEKRGLFSKSSTFFIIHRLRSNHQQQQSNNNETLANNNHHTITVSNHNPSPVDSSIIQPLSRPSLNQQPSVMEQFVPVYKSKIATSSNNSSNSNSNSNNSNAATATETIEWETISKMPLSELTGGDTLRTLLIQVFHENYLFSPTLIGQVETSIKEIREHVKRTKQNEVTLLLMDPKSEKNVGTFVIDFLYEKLQVYSWNSEYLKTKQIAEQFFNKIRQAEKIEKVEFKHKYRPIQNPFSFIDYLKGGLEIQLIVAVDFSCSNKDPSIASSLHHTSSAKKSEYEEAITAVGNIVKDYDSDNKFLAYGFGGKHPTLGTLHCFTLGSEDPEQIREFEGINAVVDAYKWTLDYYEMGRPTYLAPLIYKIAQHVKGKCGRNTQKYFIMLVVTDGDIYDMDETIESLVGAALIPLSIIIVGVGNYADGFEKMRILDSDEKPLITSDGENWSERDLVQFLEFNKYKDNVQKLAEAALREIPRQVCEFTFLNGISPKKVIDENVLTKQNLAINLAEQNLLMADPQRKASPIVSL